MTPEYSVKIFVDGDSWCVLYGSDLQSGLAGFGDTITDALEDFAAQWESLAKGKGLHP